jgi:CheY-like chemotaxis protein
MFSTPIQILLTEDDEVDAEALERSFRRANISHHITVARDGLEALDILRGHEGYARLSTPYLILLDINMPRMNGIEFLAALREDEALRSSVVFVLTTSDNYDDKIAAYNYFVAGYILKHRAGNSFSELAAMLDHYTQLVEFPHK